MAEDVQQVTRPWAYTFDLILSEYAGYTDDSILDLPLARIRQMVDVIQERKSWAQYYDNLFRLKVAEAESRALGSLLAGVAQTSKASKKITQAASALDFGKMIRKPGESTEKELPSTNQVLRLMGVRDGTGLAGVRHG